MRSFCITSLLLLTFALGCQSLAPEHPADGNSYPITYLAPVPADSAVLDTWAVDLSWQKIGPVEDSLLVERVQLYHADMGETLDLRQGRNQSVSFPLLFPAEYSWQVIGQVEQDTVGISPLWNFKLTATPPGPAVPEPILPEPGDTLDCQHVYLWWREATHPDAVSPLFYRVFLREENSSFSMLADSLTENYQDFTAKIRKGHFYWYVTCFDDHGNEASSAIMEFSISMQPQDSKVVPVNSWYCRYPLHLYSVVEARIAPFESNWALLYYSYETGGGNTGVFDVPNLDRVAVYEESVQRRFSEYGGSFGGFTPGHGNTYFDSGYLVKRIFDYYDYETVYRTVEREIVVSRLSLRGPALWSHTFSDAPKSTQLVDGHGDTLNMVLRGISSLQHIALTPSGGVVATGDMVPVDRERGVFIAYELDEEGNELWRTIDRDLEEQHGYFITNSPGGFLALVVSIDEQTFERTLWVWLLSPSGEVLDRISLPVSGSRMTVRAEEVPGAGLAVLVKPSWWTSMLLMLDDSGNLLWSKDLTGETYSSTPYLLTVNGNGEIVVASWYSLLAFTPDGNQVWSNDTAQGYSIVATGPAPDGGLYMLLTHYSREAYWAKTNAQGKCKDLFLNE